MEVVFWYHCGDNVAVYGVETGVAISRPIAHGVPWDEGTGLVN